MNQLDNDSSIFNWLIHPARWSVTQRIIAISVLLIMMSAAASALTGWRGSGFGDLCVYAGLTFLAGGIVRCIYRRSRQ